jgi:hypothetical protein
VAQLQGEDPTNKCVKITAHITRFPNKCSCTHCIICRVQERQDASQRSKPSYLVDSEADLDALAVATQIPDWVAVRIDKRKVHMPPPNPSRRQTSIAAW